jgi:hypothetical protein
MGDFAENAKDASLRHLPSPVITDLIQKQETLLTNRKQNDFIEQEEIFDFRYNSALASTATADAK